MQAIPSPSNLSGFSDDDLAGIVDEGGYQPDKKKGKFSFCCLAKKGDTNKKGHEVHFYIGSPIAKLMPVEQGWGNLWHSRLKLP